MKISKMLSLLTLTLLLGACSAPRLAYFQDIENDGERQVAHVMDIRVRPNDKISIIVKSKDPLLSNLFNLPIVTQRIGQVSKYDTYPQGVIAYTVDYDGNIDFPVIGMIHIEGMNRQEIAECVKSKLIEEDLVKDPVVNVEFVNLTVSVLGEVNHPGRFNIDRDRLTLLDAIGMAGDIGIKGQRENVTVQREENGKQKIYRVNLNSGTDLYASPVYYLQQNDVVYVEPNKFKQTDSTVSDKSLRWTSLILSMASLLSTLCIAIFL